jgi:hypothetical protein
MQLRQQGEGRRDEREQHRLERGDPQRAAHLAQRRAKFGLRQFEPLQDRLGVRDQDARLRGQPHAAPGRFQQCHPSLLRELVELLRDRGRTVGQRLGHGRERAEPVDLAQQPETVHVEHADPLPSPALVIRQFSSPVSLENIRWTNQLSVADRGGMSSLIRTP